MKIYTKQGDAGETGLYGGTRVPKDNLRIQAYGTLDELNASLGLALAEPQMNAVLRQRLVRTQNELFQLGAELATPQGRKLSMDLIGPAETRQLETEIDSMEADLAPLKSFILPGGGRLASLLHLARTVSRRGERELITLNRAESLRPEVLMYVNRMSDYLFVSARWANWVEKVSDVPWVAPGAPARGKSKA